VAEDPDIEAPVPCNGCTACCFKRVDIDPAKERPDSLRHLDLVPNPVAAEGREGPMMLRQRADGGCVHLGPKGCTVRNYRPLACRIYDCRFTAVAGILPPEAKDRPGWPTWVFRTDAFEDRVFMAALQMAVFRVTSAQPGADEFEILLGAFGQLPTLEPMMADSARHFERAISKLPADEREKLLNTIDQQLTSVVARIEALSRGQE
jgi:hypothetical protein